MARFIHARSRRAAGALHAVNCGALSESLLESELFGHKKGAFTGATGDKSGAFEAARAGSLFLDEIGETSPAAQVKLLRALQERTIRLLGAALDIEWTLRVVAATNRDLPAIAPGLSPHDGERDWRCSSIPNGASGRAWR